MSGPVYRIHPSIGIARVGNSPEYYLGPETMAGFPKNYPDEPPSEAMGGLPIKAGTEDQLITSADIRDADGALKRQAARFKIFRYEDGNGCYPSGAGTEIGVGDKVDGRTVADIIWTVHLANKKANWYVEPERGILDYMPSPEDPQGVPKLRNLQEGSSPSDPSRLEKLMIDPGPRTIRGTSQGPVEFDSATTPSYWESGTDTRQAPDYPTSFPADHFKKLNAPTGQIIGSLGELETDAQGRLIVLPAYGLANGWYEDENDRVPFPLDEDVNNDGWFDDIGDGPVQATLVFDDGSVHEVEGSAWAITTDPGYAPQTLNVVSLWDDVYDSWIRRLSLRPDLYKIVEGYGEFDAKGTFDPEYEPGFGDEVHPIFRAAQLQQWNTNLNATGKDRHDAVGNLTADSPPNATLVTKIIRDPENPGELDDTGRMPLSLGDRNYAFLTPSVTQYFFLKQWGVQGKHSTNSGLVLGPGEYLDKAVLVNCLGGRFSPGIEMTFICRDPALYVQDWQTSGGGPFRINAKPLSYGEAEKGTPFLTAGYTPLRSDPVEPGDVSKFMSIPWHTDYNSCATHPANLHNPVTGLPEPSGHYWSWPAERPVAVYAAKDVVRGNLGIQRFSVRGPGTATSDEDEVGRYQVREDMLDHWHEIGVVIQGTAIEGGDFSPDQYLEVESLLQDSGNQVEPWPAAGS